MKSIGGYFELELNQGEHYHQDAIKLNSARSCLEYILRARESKKIYIPYYTCNAILDPIKRLNIDYEFYSIDENFDPIFNKEIRNNECFLYTNYFGLKQKTVELCASKITNLIVDNSQAFFSPAIENVDTFYSARKFFGVPDGGYLYTNRLLNEEFNLDYSSERMNHLFKRIELGAEAGYPDFNKNEAHFHDAGLLQMSKITDALMRSIDYNTALNKRRENYKYFYDSFYENNMYRFAYNSNDCPIAYPYFTVKGELKEYLINSKVFIPTYWPNVLEECSFNTKEYFFAENILSLPIDQRYSICDMQRILKLIHEFDKNNLL